MDRFPPPHPIYPPVIHYGPAPIPLRKEPHIPLTPKTGMRREEIERRIAEAGVTAEERAAWNAKYQKPSTGIPKTDLASGVQASLGKADTALQEHQSLEGYATEEWVEDQGYLTEHQDITGKVDKSALFDNPDTTPKVKSALLPSYVDDVLEFDTKENPASGQTAFPTTGETGKIYVAKDTNKTYRWGSTEYVQVGGDELPTLATVATTGDYGDLLNKPTIPTVPTNVSAFTNDAGYLTQHQSLSAYRTASAQDAIDGAQDAAISAKYTKPATGIPAGDLAAGVIPSVPSASDATPQMDGAGAAGTATTYARGDHRHPSDTNKLSKTGNEETSGYLLVRNTLGVKESADAQSDYISLDAYPGRLKITTRRNGVVNSLDLPSETGTAARLEDIPATVAPSADSSASGKPADAKATGDALATKVSSASIAAAYNPAKSSAYAIGDYCTYQGALYRCTTATASPPGSWTGDANWTPAVVTDEMGADTPLPFDAECEYVTVPAGAYIDPGVLAYDASLGIEATFRIPSSPTPGEGSFRCGIWDSNTSTFFQLYINDSSNLKLFRYAQSFSSVSNSPFVGSFGTASAIGSTFSNGTNKTGVSSDGNQHTPFPFLICALASNSTPDTCVNPVDIAAFKFSFSGVSFRALVPVRVGTVGYLYDKVSGRLFGSAVGSIPLVPGPDKATPTITKPERLVEINERNNYLAYASTTTLAPETAVYRSALNADGTFPTITDTGIPTAAAYYQFELELTVPSAVPSTITGPSGWTWLDGHGLPDPADLSGGETIYISVRLDCTRRTFLASVWRVA